jgi:hypothetical protein
MSELNSAPHEQGCSAAAVERRVWVRYGSDLEATCRTPAAAKEMGWPGRVRDISAGGVGLLMRHRFRPGSPLLLELNLRGGRQVVAVRVIHATPVSAVDGPCWLLGCAFAAPLEPDALQALLSP